MENKCEMVSAPGDMVHSVLHKIFYSFLFLFDQEKKDNYTGIKKLHKLIPMLNIDK